MINAGFDKVISIENNSGHGVDLVGRNSRTGEVKVWEVKTTDGEAPGRLSNAQKGLGGEGFTNDRLAKAARGSGNYGKVPSAMRNARKAQGWLQEAINNKRPQPMKNMMYLWTILRKDVVNTQIDLQKLAIGDEDEHYG